MSNTINVSTDVFSQGSLDGFVSVMAPLNAFSTNFSPAPGQVGGTVSVPLYGSASTASNFNGDYTANSDSTINEVSVSLSTHYFKTVHVTDVQLQNQGADLYKLGYYAGQSVAKSVFTGCMNIFNTGTYGVPVQTLGSAANFSTSGVLALRTQAAGWGPEKNILCDSSYYSALLGNVPANTLIQNEALADGSIGKIYGFKMYETDVAPMAAQTSTKVIAAHPSAIAIASRYLAPEDGAYKDARPITDPKTGTTLGYRSWYDQEAGKRYATVEWLGGYSAGVTGAAKFIAGS